MSRSLAACEGALLVVDAAQGIEAQTMANVYLALEQDLAIVAVINKIDLPSADPQKVAAEVGQLIGLLDDEIVQASAKTGLGIDEILEAVVRHMPPPRGDPAGRVRALIFDSHYDPYKGVIAYVKIVDGRIASGDRIRLMANGKEAELLEVGYFDPELHPVAALGTGEVGYIATGLKIVQDVQVGDTVTLASDPAVQPAAGLSPRQTDGVRRVVSGRKRGVSDASGCPRTPAVERWLTDLGAGIIRRARFRLSLRLPWIASHGDHPGAT